MNIESGYGHIISLALGLFVLVSIVLRVDQVRAIAGWRWLVASYGCLLAGYLIEVAATTFSPKAMEILEHSSVSLSALLLAVWVWRFPIRKEYGA